MSRPKLNIEFATPDDAAAIVRVRNEAAKVLTKNFGPGFWSHEVTESSVIHGFKSAKILVVRTRSRVIASLRLATKKPWAIDPAHFTPVSRPIYLVDMAVIPAEQRQGVGRALLGEAVKVAWDWPGDSVRLDAFDSPAGAGEFYAKCGFEHRGRAIYRGNPLVYFELLRED
jgi:GNAT superfamily N-acetyltransferase